MIKSHVLKFLSVNLIVVYENNVCHYTKGLGLMTQCGQFDNKFKSVPYERYLQM